MHKSCLLALLSLALLSCGVGLESALKEGSGETGGSGGSGGSGGTDPLPTIIAPSLPTYSWSNYLLGTARMTRLSHWQAITDYMAAFELYADAIEQRFSGANALLNSLTRPRTPLLLPLNVPSAQRPLGSVEAYIYLLISDYSLLELTLTNMNNYVQNTQHLT